MLVIDLPQTQRPEGMYPGGVGTWYIHDIYTTAQYLITFRQPTVKDQVPHALQTQHELRKAG